VKEDAFGLMGRNLSIHFSPTMCTLNISSLFEIGKRGLMYSLDLCTIAIFIIIKKCEINEIAQIQTSLGS
jgi:hypothetical protein